MARCRRRAGGMTTRSGHRGVGEWAWVGRTVYGPCCTRRAQRSCPPPTTDTYHTLYSVSQCAGTRSLVACSDLA
eukprot:952795-Prymnesium_polylepis.1